MAKQACDLVVENIEIKKIHQLDNSRIKYAVTDLADLMSSIKQHGLMQPIGVRVHPTKKGEYEVMYGNRRLVAMQKLGHDEIPSILVESNDRADFLVKNLVENLQRANLSPFEEGRFFLGLKDLGLSPQEIAARLNINVRRVNVSMTVFQHVPEEFQGSLVNSRSGVKNGKLNATIAAKIVTSGMDHGRSKKDISDLLKAAKSEKFNHNQINIVTKLMKSGLSTKKAIDSIVKLRPVAINFMMLQSHIEKLERKYDDKIHNIVKEILESNTELKLVKRATYKNAKVQVMEDDNLSLSL